MVMHGFPPPPNALVTRSNWQDPPFNRWSVWHTRELLPTQRIATAGRAARPLANRARRTDLRAVPLDPAAAHGQVRTVGDVLRDSYTDAWVVLQDGELVEEWYGEEGRADAPHAVLSVSKSVVGCVAGVLVERGRLSLTDLVS